MKEYKKEITLEGIKGFIIFTIFVIIFILGLIEFFSILKTILDKIDHSVLENIV